MPKTTSPSAPVAALAARAFPYQATYATGVIRPTNVTQGEMNAAVSTHYTAWKSAYIRTDGGQGSWVKYDSTNATVSEAHGYGMVLSAYMADKSLLDDMFRFFKAHPSIHSAHLMAWKQSLSGSAMVNVAGGDSATDGDLDIAYALLLADVQWGSAGSTNYQAEALLILHDVLANEVNPATGNLTTGDAATGADANHTRPSDFMTDHLLAFAQADSANATRWKQVYSTVSAAVNYQFTHGSQNTGLMPDFMVLSGGNFIPVPGQYLETPHDGDFAYNACRTPWRLAMSFILYGKTDMLTAQQQTAAWIARATAGVPNKIRAGYWVTNGANGTAYAGYDDLAFTAPMAVNAMLGGPTAQAWLNSLWTSIAGGDYPVTVNYYGDSIRLQVLLTVSGNWWAP